MSNFSNFVDEALKQLNQAAAIDAANACIGKHLDNSSAFVALPNNFTTHDIEHLMQCRRRASGTMLTHSMDALADYAAQHHEEGAAVFVDANDMSATAVLNLGTPSKPGQADNLAKVKLKLTAAFSALLQANNKVKPQKDAAEWLEDYSSFISCLNDDGEAIATKHAVQALRHLKVDASRSTESKVGSLSASSSALDQVAVSSANPIPTLVHFHCTPYLGLPPRIFVARLGVLTGDKPGVVLRIINPEQHQEEMAQQMVDILRNTIAAKQAMPVLLGSYSKTLA